MVWAPLVVQLVKNPPTMQETWVQSLSGEDPLEKEMATHSSILVWEIPWTEEPGGLPCHPPPPGSPESELALKNTVGMSMPIDSVRETGYLPMPFPGIEVISTYDVTGQELVCFYFGLL